TYNSLVRFADITDGTSSTAMFAEVKRGTNDGTLDRLSVTSVPYNTVWDPGQPASDRTPPAACDSPTSFFDYTGLQDYRGLLWTAFAPHTGPPNYQGRDCVRSVGLDRGHLAARSYHTGGVNVLRCDGSVSFVRDSVALSAWRAFGTRSGNEVFNDN